MFTNKYCKYLTQPISPTIKEIIFKIMNNIYQAAETLQKPLHEEVDSY